MNLGIHLYCFSRSGYLTSAAYAGLKGSPVVEEFGEVTAIVNIAAAEDFSSEANWQNPEWVLGRICLHEMVVEQVMRVAPVFPVAFGAVFSSRESLGKCVAQNAATISEFLELALNREEWAVRVFLDRKEARDYLFSRRLAVEEGRVQRLSSGMRYLMEQRMRAAAEKEVPAYIGEACCEMCTVLKNHALELRVREVRSEADLDELYNWAFWVPRSENFRGQIGEVGDKYRRAGLTLQLSGPWPPYSFCPHLSYE